MDGVTASDKALMVVGFSMTEILSVLIDIRDILGEFKHGTSGKKGKARQASSAARHKGQNKDGKKEKGKAT